MVILVQLSLIMDSATHACHISDKFSGTANEFIKSVSKLSLYSDWLLLKKIKGSVSSGEQMRPSDERVTMETTQQAIQFILQYASLIDTVKRVDAQKESVPPIEYTQYVCI